MRAHPLGWPKALHPSRSPCRIDASKGKRQHRCSAHHAGLVESFRLAQEAQDRRAEAATGAYATELADYFGPDGTERRVRLGDWLRHQETRQPDVPEEESSPLG